jgi:hypothetical protein
MELAAIACGVLTMRAARTVSYFLAITAFQANTIDLNPARRGSPESNTGIPGVRARDFARSTSSIPADIPGMPNSRASGRIAGYSINETNDVQSMMTRYNTQIAILTARRNQIADREQRLRRDNRVSPGSNETGPSVEDDDKNDE